MLAEVEERPKGSLPGLSKLKATILPKERSLVCFKSSGRRFCFGRGSDESSMFRTSIVQVEKMNKKVVLSV